MRALPVISALVALQALLFSPTSVMAGSPVAGVSPGSISFGTVRVGSKQIREVEIHDLGTPFKLVALDIEGPTGQFEIEQPGSSTYINAALKNLRVAVSFKPRSEDPVSANLAVRVKFADLWLREQEQKADKRYDAELLLIAKAEKRVDLETEARRRKLSREVSNRKNELNAVIQAKESALDELRRGRYCSQCKRTASQIEAEEHVSFYQHLGKVQGVPIPASQAEIDAKEKEFDQKIKSARNAVASAIDAVSAAEQQAEARMNDLKKQRLAAKQRYDNEMDRIRALKHVEEKLTVAVAGRGKDVQKCVRICDIEKQECLLSSMTQEGTNICMDRHAQCGKKCYLDAQ